MKKVLLALSLVMVALAVFLATGGGRWALVQLARQFAEPSTFEPPADIKVVRDIVFAETETGPLALDVYMPAERADGPMPVLVFVFGGGWFSGNKHQLRLMNGHLLARAGYAAVATTYRHSDVAHFPAQIHDVKATVRWVRANADEFGFDSEAIGAFGGSAGGHLVALLATTNGHAELEGEVGSASLSSFSSDVRAVVSFFGPAHLPSLFGIGCGARTTNRFASCRKYLFSTALILT